MSVPLNLVFETSTPRGSVALADCSGMLEQRFFDSDRSHNSVLFSPLKELLAARGERHIEQVIVGSGPGSYSGTRVGIAAAQGVAIAMNCPVVAIPSILAVASASSAVRCLAMGDARRGSYWTAYLGKQQLMTMPELTDTAGLEIIVRRAIAADNIVFSFEDPKRFPLASDLLEKINWEYPTAAQLWQAWLAADDTTRIGWLAEVPQPIYLKPPHITPSKRSSLLNS